MLNSSQLEALQLVITEGLRVQRNGQNVAKYIDTGGELVSARAKQNHVIFGRRGCGKSLLLQTTENALPADSGVIYLNCEDFKHHSFPNVLIEILEAIFGDIKTKLPRFFGDAKSLKKPMQDLLQQLEDLKKKNEEIEQEIKEHKQAEAQIGSEISGGLYDAKIKATASKLDRSSLEVAYKQRLVKSEELHRRLPKLKSLLNEFFEKSDKVKTIFLHVDDFYHLARTDQPFVMDYIHRLCKDTPLFFKVATLRYSSVLFLNRKEQPIGAQERHDYQSINVDFTFEDFERTKRQVDQIFNEYGRLAGLTTTNMDGLFRGDGFGRLIMAGGGVPRDCLSLFLEALSQVKGNEDPRIGKDDVRVLSRKNFERKVDDLQRDSEVGEKDDLLKGIYAVREFCLQKKTSVFFVEEKLLKEHEEVRDMFFRLLDYRIIHGLGEALTHKSASGTFRAFMIDIGCYAHLRKHVGKMTEYDLSDNNIREVVRSVPIISAEELRVALANVPINVFEALADDDA